MKKICIGNAKRKQMNNTDWRNQVWKLGLGLVCIIVMTMNMSFATKAYIQTQGSVKAASAVIRAEANADSEALASVVQGNSLTINNETTDASGTVWYQVFVDSQTLGYIRSDLVEKSGNSGASGTTGTSTNNNADANQTTGTNNNANANQAASTNNNADANQTTGTDNNADANQMTGIDNNTDADNNTDVGTDTSNAADGVTAMQPQRATITGAMVRIREKATTSSTIVTTVEQGTELRLTGQAADSSGKTWYQATFEKDGTEVTGFVRKDFIELGELLEPVEEEPPTEPDESEEEPEEIVENKDYELEYKEDEEGEYTWYLRKNLEGTSVKLEELLQAKETSQNNLEVMQKAEEKQKIIIILLAIVIVILVLAVTLLLFKVRDLSYDDFYEDYDEPEPKPVRKTQTGRNPQTQTVNQGQGRPMQGQQAGQRQSRPVQGQPVKQNQGQSRPIQGQPTGQRQSRPAQGQQAGQRQSRPVQGQPGNQKQARPVQEQPINQGQMKPPKSMEQDSKNNGWKSKNFMMDEDEFEFEFLNWDGEE